MGNRHTHTHTLGTTDTQEHTFRRETLVLYFFTQERTRLPRSACDFLTRRPSLQKVDVR